MAASAEPRDSNDARSGEPGRLVRRGRRNDGKDDLTRPEHSDALVPADQLAVRRPDGADSHEVVLRDPGLAERHLEARELLPVTPHPLGQERLAREEDVWIDHRCVASFGW